MAFEHYYIQRPVHRRVSRSAKYAPFCGRLALLSLVLALIMHRFGLIEQPILVFFVCLAIFFAGLALLLSAIALFNLWRNGDRGGRSAVKAIFYALLVLLPVTLFAVMLLSTPKLYDISTDIEEPVEFNTLMNNRPHEAGTGIVSGLKMQAMHLLETVGFGDLARENTLTPLPANHGLQQLSAYPEVTGRQYDSTQDHVLRAVSKVLKDEGFTLTGSFGASGEGRDITIEAREKSFYLGLKSDVAIRLRDQDDQAVVDMRAVSRYGQYDFGRNAELITRFFAALDLEMRNAVPDVSE